jgi:hypothetical protein
MILISHKGNLEGPNPSRENHPDYIKRALWYEFHVEVDVWMIKDKWFLGHDGPEYPVEYRFLNDSRFYLHCKNLESLTYLATSEKTECDFFAHGNDNWVLTGKGRLWTYPREATGPNSIIVDFSKDAVKNHSGIYGLCADYLI